MKIAVLNPNTNQAMTDAVVAEVQKRCGRGVQITGMTALDGVAVIDSRESFAIGAQSARKMLSEVAPDTDAVLLACFGDPGLQGLRAATSLRIVGLAEAAILRALHLARPFAIVTAGADWVPLLEECVALNAASGLLIGVYALPGNGARLQRDPEAHSAGVRALSVQAADAGARTLILGGAAFAGLHFDADARLTVLDAMDAATAALLNPGLA